MVIWKYHISQKRLALAMPQNAQILHVAVQANEIMLWAKCHPENPLEERNIEVVATGERFAPVFKYLGTVHIEGLVWHVMERT
jgi:hypothetical protein